MTLEQLRILSRVVELGTIKAAADSLHKTQPALTMAIKKLENEYGFEILDRSQYRLSLTTAGKAFYQKSMALLLNCALWDNTWGPAMKPSSVWLMI